MYNSDIFKDSYVKIFENLENLSIIINNVKFNIFTKNWDFIQNFKFYFFKIMDKNRELKTKLKNLP